MATLKIERIGGLAGFGVPGSKLTSSGEAALSALSAADRAAVEDLFKNPSRPPDPGSHPFRYKITRVEGGREQTIEVPESVVPQALQACVKDRLR